MEKEKIPCGRSVRLSASHLVPLDDFDDNTHWHCVSDRVSIRMILPLRASIEMVEKILYVLCITHPSSETLVRRSSMRLCSGVVASGRLAGRS